MYFAAREIFCISDSNVFASLVASAIRAFIERSCSSCFLNILRIIALPISPWSLTMVIASSLPMILSYQYSQYLVACLRIPTCVSSSSHQSQYSFASLRTPTCVSGVVSKTASMIAGRLARSFSTRSSFQSAILKFSVASTCNAGMSYLSAMAYTAMLFRILE